MIAPSYGGISASAQCCVVRTALLEESAAQCASPAVAMSADGVSHPVNRPQLRFQVHQSPGVLHCCVKQPTPARTCVGCRVMRACAVFVRARVPASRAICLVGVGVGGHRVGCGLCT